MQVYSSLQVKSHADAWHAFRQIPISMSSYVTVSRRTCPSCIANSSASIVIILEQESSERMKML